MKQMTKQELALIDAEARLRKLAKDISDMGDTYVSAYHANIIAHKADLGANIILKVLRCGGK